MRIITLLTALVLVQISTAQTPTEIKAILPQLAGWTIDETVEVFDSDNLYERINGAAPGFFLYHFKELTCFEYIQTEAGDNPPYISVQVYRHATREDAFGIYASERPSETDFLAIGAEGYQEGSMLNFFVDDLYIKMESPSVEESVVEAIQKIASEFGRNINQQPVFPAQLQMFPAGNKIPHSELYISTGFLGHEFLNRAFIANYQADRKKYQLFIMDAGSMDQAKATLERYMQFTRQNLRLREGRLTIKDRFNGELECLWTGRYILGIVNDSNAPVKADEMLKEAGKKLNL
jgi:hypothetical protein